jgi:hypothetical protein
VAVQTAAVHAGAEAAPVVGTQAERTFRALAVVGARRHAAAQNILEIAALPAYVEGIEAAQFACTGAGAAPGDKLNPVMHRL